MLESLEEEIVGNYKVGDDMVKTEREGRLRIAEVAKAMDIKLVRIISASYWYHLRWSNYVYTLT